MQENVELSSLCGAKLSFSQCTVQPKSETSAPDIGCKADSLDIFFSPQLCVCTFFHNLLVELHQTFFSANCVVPWLQEAN